MEKYKYKISVITPIYNVEQYLEETIESVLRQSIGFLDNVQLILVNDGSPDDSYIICKKYEEQYPENIVYIEKENGGVSSARNEGMRHIEGKYTVFLDGDDMWEKHAFEHMYDFFEKSAETFDVCSCKMEYTGDYEGKTHPLDYKFEKGRRVDDLSKEPTTINTTIGNMAFRSSSLKGSEFNEKISSGEDAEFTNSILIDKEKVGILPEAVFYYRRNYAVYSGSSSAKKTKAWYLQIPREYYLKLEEKAIRKCGKVPPFIQFLILYDLRWRTYNEKMVDTLTEDEKAQHISIMKKVMRSIDLGNINAAEGLNQHKKLYLMNLKYDKEIIRDAVREDAKFYYKGQQVLSLRGSSMLFIKAFDITDNVLSIEGIVRANATKLPWELIIRDEEGAEYKPVYKKFPKGDIRGYVGEMISEGILFYATIPLHINRKVYFFLRLDGEEMEFRPTFDGYIGINRGQRNNYTVKSGYVIKLRKNKLSFYGDRKRNRMMSEMRLLRELVIKRTEHPVKNRIYANKKIKAVNDSRIENRIAFVSVRSDENLMENLDRVYTLIDEPKIKYCSKKIQSEKEKNLSAAQVIYSSKVVVTDDYLSVLRDNNKREGQYYVQLWHAAGAFKKFGVDGTPMSPGMDAMYHRDYDLVSVSSEYIRKIYAKAFQIDIEKVQALGFPRSDKLYDSNYLKETKKDVFDNLPELRDKQIILYAPSFRGEGRGRKYVPDIDYEVINKSLRDDQIMVLSLHPLAPPYEGSWNYDRIKLVQNISTNKIMVAADLLITDYSSVIFEYSLLDKPMIFFCYDLEEYNRDFYLDYENDLPGERLSTLEQLTDYLKQIDFTKDERLNAFKEKYMSACDGHCAERIAEVLTEYLKK